MPSQIPQRKPYVEFFPVLEYKFPSWWKPQLDIFQRQSMPVVQTNPVFGKIIVAGENVWFTYFPDDSLARYNTQSHKIKYYNIPDEYNKPFWVYDIYLARDGTLWMALDSPGKYSALARYVPSSDAFEIVTDKDGLFERTGGGYSQDPVDASSNRIGVLPDGQLVVNLNNEIYLYNPATNQAKLILEHTLNLPIQTIIVGHDGNIWFTTSGFSDLDLRAVDSTTGQLTDYDSPPSLTNLYKTKGETELEEAAKAIALDQQGRVWVSYFDRLEPGPKGEYAWHSMDLPAVFVNTFDPDYAYRWANNFSTNVFSNGDIWFASDVGIVEYGVQKDSWCLSVEIKTFVEYPITQDAEGNVWTVLDNQIYELKP